mgnify:CR=1 FL=1
MRIKAVSSLVGGEVLAEPILTEKNDILIPNGTRIKPDYVPLIESLGIESVSYTHLTLPTKLEV